MLAVALAPAAWLLLLLLLLLLVVALGVATLLSELTSLVAAAAVAVAAAVAPDVAAPNPAAVAAAFDTGCFLAELRLVSLTVALPLPETPPISVGHSPTLLKSLACTKKE